jgi:hypothetical protein
VCVCVCVEEIDIEFGEAQKARELESECFFIEHLMKLFPRRLFSLEAECIVLCKVTLVCHFLWEQGARFFN